jgi:hypothetical protein
MRERRGNTGLSMWMALAWWAAARAEPPSGPGSDAPVGQTLAFHDQLFLAKQQLQRGELSSALASLTGLRDRLDAGETPPPSIAHEALVFLGDAQLTAGDSDAARVSFRRVLLAEPDHVVSPYHHTEEVRAFFALVREAVRQEIAGAPPPPPEPVPRRPPLPVWGYAPLGVPQLVRGRTAAGVMHGGAQGGLLACSIATYVFIRRANEDPLDGHPFNWTEAEVQARVPLYRRAVQWPCTAAFYGAWAVSVVDAGLEWQRSDHPDRPRSVSVAIVPGGVMVGGVFGGPVRRGRPPR